MDLTPESIRNQLEQLLGGETLSKSTGNRRLLNYLVQHSLNSPDGPKEIEIAIEAFGRDVSFNGAEDSVVRVAMRSLRQKLFEHYAGPGKHDALIFDIPKGGYRVTVTPRKPAESPAEPARDVASPEADGGLAAASAGSRANRNWRWSMVLLLPLLAISVGANLYAFRHRPNLSPMDTEQDRARRSPLWNPIVQSNRPLVIVLGDLFMYTQTDPKTGRTQTVRDSQINSSEDLRAFLASNPSLAAERGLRYASMIQKSTAIGMVQILQILDRPGRRIEVRLRDELQAEDIRARDIVYVGPIARLGPLASDYHLRSRFRFDPKSASVTDTQSGRVFAPEGELGDRHKDYALVARYPGPTGNSIMIFTSGGRNAGLQQVVRTFTDPQSLSALLKTSGGEAALPASFEALLAVSGYKQTDLAAELVELTALSQIAKDAASGNGS